MKLIDKNSKDELAPFRETIDSWLLILLGEDPRLKHQKMQENGEKFTEKWEGYRLWRQCNTWPSIYRQFKEYIEKYIIDNNELPSGVHVIEERIFNNHNACKSYVDFDVPEKIYPEDDDDIMIAEAKKEKLLEPFRPTIDSWTEHIAGKEPEDMLSCLLWRVRYIKVKLYIEHYIKAHNELPSGVHFIMNFDDPDDDLPENLGDNSGFVNFDECPKSTINRRKV